MKQNTPETFKKKSEHTSSHALLVKITAGICVSLLVGSIFTCLIR